jgi:hypothetical protein
VLDECVAQVESIEAVTKVDVKDYSVGILGSEETLGFGSCRG